MLGSLLWRRGGNQEWEPEDEEQQEGDEPMEEADQAWKAEYTRSHSVENHKSTQYKACLSDASGGTADMRHEVADTAHTPKLKTSPIT